MKDAESNRNNWNTLPPHAYEEVKDGIPWARQAFLHRRIAFYGAFLLAVVSFGMFLLVIAGYIGCFLGEHALIVTLTVLGLIPTIVVMALLRHGYVGKAADKETADVSLLTALAKEIAKLFGKN
jgi:hypothetical protein